MWRISLGSVDVTPEEIRFCDNCPSPILGHRRGIHIIGDPKIDFDTSVRQLCMTLRALTQGGKHRILLLPSDDLHLNMIVAGEMELAPYLCYPLAGRVSLPRFVR